MTLARAVDMEGVEENPNPSYGNVGEGNYADDEEPQEPDGVLLLFSGPLAG